jgi:hypothetical protein
MPPAPITITVAIDSFYKTTFSGGARADCRS